MDVSVRWVDVTAPFRREKNPVETFVRGRAGDFTLRDGEDPSEARRAPTDPTVPSPVEAAFSHSPVEPSSPTGPTVVAPALEWFCGLLVNHRWLWLLIAAFSVCAGQLWTPALQFDQSLEALYSHDNPRLRDFKESKRVFGGDELAIVAWTQDRLMEPEGMAKTGEFGEQLAQVPGIRADSQQNLRDTSG